ncbi:hypothetical protein PR118_001266 [Bacillus atrophaeus]|nr:hypothetical protein [Bacillus atrophaeus]
MHNKVHVVISESAGFHKEAIADMEAQDGVRLSDKCQQNTLGSVIVNGKRSVWPLTKSEALAQGGPDNG